MRLHLHSPRKFSDSFILNRSRILGLRNIFNSIVTIMAVASGILGKSSQASDFQLKQNPISTSSAPKEVEWKDIAYWQALEERWALAFDTNHQLIAIYDLSFPGLLDRTLITKLGTKKISGLNEKNLTKSLLKEAEKNQTLLNEEELQSLNTLKTQSDSLGSFVNQFSSSRQKQLNDSQDIIKDAFETSFLESDWNTIPLKNQTGDQENNSQKDNSQKNNSFEEFRLSDIDWSKVSKETGRIEAYLDEMNTAFPEEIMPNDSIANARSVADSLVFRKQGKEIHLYWEPPVLSKTSISRPKKLVDLRWTPAGFKEGLYWYALESGLDKIADLIQAPFLSGIVKTGLDRFFHYHKMLFRVQQNQLLEYLNDVYDQAQGGSGIFDPNRLTDSEKNLAIESIIFSQTSLTSTYKWIWKKPFQEFIDSRNKSIQYSFANQDWYRQRDLSLSLLNIRFGERNDDSNEGNYISLGLKALKQKSNDESPLIAYSPRNPDLIFKSRLTREIITIAVVFGTHFMPGVGGPIRSAYKKLFQSPIDQQVGFEAKLLTHLEKQGEDELVLGTLTRQRINPFVLDIQKTKELIRLRKLELGIPAQP